MHKSLIALATAGALAFSASAASAATGGTATLDKPFSWSGGPGQGLLVPLVLDQAPVGPGSDAVMCSDLSECDDTLVQVGAADAGNDLTFTLSGEAGNTPTIPLIDEGADLDLFVYKSDAAGAIGDELGESISSTADEIVTLPAAEAGYYLVRINYYNSVDATYTAKAALSVPVPPDPEEEEE